MIYIVEVLERMLILAAIRLSMIALEKKRQNGRERGWKQRGQTWKERKEKLNTSKPPAVYQLQHETEPFITVHFKQAAGKELLSTKFRKRW